MSCINLKKKLQPAKKVWKSITNSFQSKLHKLKKISKPIKRTAHRFIALKPIKSIFRKKHKLTTLTNNHRNSHHQTCPCRHHHLRRHQQQLQKGFAAIYVDELYAGKDRSIKMKKQTEATAESETSKAGENGIVLKTSYGKAKAEVAVMTVQQLQIPKMEVKIVDEKAKAVASRSSAAEKWRAAVSMLPQLRGVDERAEEFISKFREEMKLQRENSNLEHQEMLARGS